MYAKDVLGAGHIPGAASIPWQRALRADGTFKSVAELEEIYPGDDEPIIAYCRTGERSAHTWSVLHELLGRRQVKNCDGGWAEWANLVGVPICASSSTPAHPISPPTSHRSPAVPRPKPSS
jgi:thiosulfate/3-mercaptopyruvate sulfurtransferase